MYNINDSVLVEFRDNKYPATIIDIEEGNEYSGMINGVRQYDKIVQTGRYGVKFDGENPTLIDVPYFWEKDLTLL